MEKNSYNDAYFESYLKPGTKKLSRRDEDSLSTKFWANYLLKKLKGKSKVLEVGCGLGFLGKRISRDFEYHAIDISEYAVQFAKSANKLENVSVGVAEKLDFENTMFDAVISFDVVEHLETPKLFFKEARRVLKQDEVLVISTPNPDGFGNKIKDKEGAYIASMYRDKTHVSLLKFDKWVEIAQNSGFKFVSEGTDSLWDMPYFRFIPHFIEKVIFVPFNILTMRYFGFYPWRLGENSIFVFKIK